MQIADCWSRAQGKYYRTGARLFYRRPLVLTNRTPLISFTFDDFPRSALLTGGRTLKRFGAAGTYYVSLGLMGKTAPTGKMFVMDDLRAAVEDGHELGCHTFDHCHAADTATSYFEASVIENRLALEKLLPGVAFRTFSYPISPPRIQTKKRMAKHFVCCRGGGQTFNQGTADLSYLASFFLEQSRDDEDSVRELIDQNRAARGWLVLATHDISESPTPYGCTPAFFGRVVEYAVHSGARIVSVLDAWKLLQSSAGDPAVTGK